MMNTDYSFKFSWAGLFFLFYTAFLGQIINSFQRPTWLWVQFFLSLFSQGIFDRGNEVQPKTDFILGPRKSFPEQLETKRRIQKSSKQVTSK